MLTVRMVSPPPAASKELSSAHFALLGNMFVDAEGRELASLNRGILLAPAGIYLCADILSPVRLIFENDEFSVREELDPIPALKLINGGLWDLEQHPKLMAEFDYMLNRWHVRERPAIIMCNVKILPAS